MYSRHRLDGLGDAIYGVAMTLLVLEIRLPEGFQPHSNAELLAALQALAPKFWPYLLSFAVLGGRWRAIVKDREAHHHVERPYVTWWLFHLFSVTLIPFSSMLIGRYATFAAAVWVYSANIAALSLTGWGLTVSAPAAERQKVGENRVGVILMLTSAVLAVAQLRQPGRRHGGVPAERAGPDAVAVVRAAESARRGYDAGGRRLIISIWARSSISSAASKPISRPASRLRFVRRSASGRAFSISAASASP
jgi:uncharacterized membrane protein